MKKSILFIQFLLLSGFCFAQIIKKSDFVIGETLEIESKILAEKRNINIYLPNGYSPDSVKVYPIIYLLDGSVDEDFIHIAGLVQFCSFSWINIMPESIVVGIGNVDRKKDFTYPGNNKRDNEEFPTTGGSENFIKFIKDELQPLISENYHVSNDKTIIGQSLGGLLATQILFQYPEMFDNYIITSPSLWWDDEKLLDETLPDLSGKKIYIGVGKEGDVMERVAEELYNKIKKGNDDLPLYFQFFEKQNHGDVLHLAVYDAFEKMFKPKKIEE